MKVYLVSTAAGGQEVRAMVEASNPAQARKRFYDETLVVTPLSTIDALARARDGVALIQAPAIGSAAEPEDVQDMI